MTVTALDYLRQLVEPTGVSGAEQNVVRRWTTPRIPMRPILTSAWEQGRR